MRASGIVLAMVCGFAAAAGRVDAAELVVAIVDGQGAPVEDAVVTATPRDASLAPPPRAPATRVIDQKDERFVPTLEVFRPGDRLVFHNSDPTRHHVYSFADAKAFEFVLASGEQSAPIVLDKPGIIAAGCNIHDTMIAHAFVSDAPWLARSDATGHVRIEGLRAGIYDIAVWHPRQRPGRALAPQPVTIDAVVTSVAATFTLPLLADPHGDHGRERSGY
ncbi:hypothetical protein ACQQ2N_03565 [Dokdonella sp. MW10]|uniref:hypothetical protein n=1 Tax=Dokdonella sp. MW10 TaxID=2992926 RepID=UPI003F8141D9